MHQVWWHKRKWWKLLSGVLCYISTCTCIQLLIWLFIHFQNDTFDNSMCNVIGSWWVRCYLHLRWCYHLTKENGEARPNWLLWREPSTSHSFNVSLSPLYILTPPPTWTQAPWIMNHDLNFLQPTSQYSCHWPNWASWDIGAPRDLKF